MSYLTSTNYAETIRKVTYLDQTYLINKAKTVAMQAKTDYRLGTRATVIISSIEQGDYIVYLNGTAYSHPVTSSVPALHILQELQTLIDPTKASPPAASMGYVAEIYGSYMEITSVPD